MSMERTMRITMVGASGSGKTSFLSGVYQSMVDDSINGLKFVPVGNISDKMKGISRLSEVSIIENGLRFASGTASTTTFPLTLKKRDDKICDFEFIDYRGGTIEDMFAGDADAKDAAEIQEHIRKSDAVIVFADSVLLSHYQNIQQCRLATKANRINILFDLLSQHFEKWNLSVLLALTKADDPTIPKEYKDDYFYELRRKGLTVFKGVSECVGRHRDSNWSFGVVPVSAVGFNVAHTEKFETGVPATPVGFRSTIKAEYFPSPFNIDVAMIHSIYCVLKAWEYECTYFRDENFEKLKKENKNNTFWGNLFVDDKEKPATIVANLRGQIHALERQINFINAGIYDIVNSVRPDKYVVDRIDGFSLYPKK